MSQRLCLTALSELNHTLVDLAQLAEYVKKKTGCSFYHLIYNHISTHGLQQGCLVGSGVCVMPTLS